MAIPVEAMNNAAIQRSSAEGVNGVTMHETESATETDGNDDNGKRNAWIGGAAVGVSA